MYMHETKDQRLGDGVAGRDAWSGFDRRVHMRALVLAVLLAVPTVAAAPAGAAAQTAGDIARLAWPFGAPAYTGTAPVDGLMFGGIDHGVSRQIWLQRTKLADGVAPKEVYAGAFTAADLARSRSGGSGQPGILKAAPVLTATAEPGRH